jgi:hypothetical protein
MREDCAARLHTVGWNPESVINRTLVNKLKNDFPFVHLREGVESETSLAYRYWYPWVESAMMMLVVVG